ncbi:MAG: hypothetical protein JJLCMIEE_03613 [Acidimicrobiales bacterium]|nr:hypothetical protein [Acidimicrobiales bacterium]
MYRYLAIAVLTLATVVFDSSVATPGASNVAGNQRWWVAGVLVLVGLPYNLACDLLVRRTGTLPTVTAYGDYLAILIVVLARPELYTPAAMILLALLSEIILGFGKRVAFRAAAGAIVALIALGVYYEPTGWLTTLVVFVVTSQIGIIVVGAVSEGELAHRLRYRDLVSGVDAVVWEADGATGPPRYIDENVVELLGYPREAWYDAGHWESVVHPDDSAVVDERRQRICEGSNDEAEYRMRTADGTVIWVHEVVRTRLRPTGEVIGRRGVFIDVSDRKRAEERVNQYADIVEHIQVALFIVRLEDVDDDESLRIVAANPEGARIANRSTPEVVGQMAVDVFPQIAATEMPGILANVVRDGMPAEVQNFEVEGQNQAVIFGLRAFPLPGQAAGISLYDVTDQAMTAQALRHQALHDPLTGLPNRLLLHDRLETALHTAERTSSPIALLVIDLDEFKEVNDTFGHHHGDRLLVELSNRFTDVLREADTVARLGGDEFAVLLTTNASRSGAITVAQRIAHSLEEPVNIDGISLQVGASVGIAFYPEHATDADTLVQKADFAMYAAKRNRGRSAIYASDNERSSASGLTLLDTMKQAIYEGRFVVHYQPIIDLSTGAVASLEALLRWDHPDHGPIAPADLIELAEASDMIQRLTQILLEKAARDVTRWHEKGHDLSITVNLSVRDLYTTELCSWITGEAHLHRAPGPELRLELTKSGVMQDPLLAMQVVAQLRQQGVEIGVNNYEAGHPPLSYLQNKPIDEIKINRAFISDMEQGDTYLVRSIIALAHDLGLRALAEGVEQCETLRQLRDLGCDRAQGCIISPPLDLEACEAWLSTKSQANWNNLWVPGVGSRL